MDTLSYRKNFDHMLKYLVFDITDKAVVKFELWHDDAAHSSLALHKPAHIYLFFM